jgi:guanylate kinase
VNRRGVLCVVSGPSGSGKTTICHRAAAELPGVSYSVSCTTRPPREGEVDHVDYHFLGREDFEARIARGEFLEHALVHQKHHYGTLKSEVLEHLRNGRDVVMDLDVQGAAQLRSSADEEIQRSLVDVFILPSSLEDLEARIRGRGAMSEEELSRRLRNAEVEMVHWPEYAYTIVTGEREEDFARFTAILDAERLRTLRLRAEG